MGEMTFIQCLCTSQEFSLQVRTEFVDQVVNHAERNACSCPLKRRSNTRIRCWIVSICKATGSDAAEQLCPVEGTPSRIITSHHRTGDCVHQAPLERAGPLAKISRILMK